MARRTLNPERKAEIRHDYEYRCCYCGGHFRSEKLTVDHIVPVAQGGPNKEENLVLACFDCNQLKGNRGLSEFIRLLRPLAKNGEKQTYYRSIIANIRSDLFSGGKFEAILQTENTLKVVGKVDLIEEQREPHIAELKRMVRMIIQKGSVDFKAGVAEAKKGLLKLNKGGHLLRLLNTERTALEFEISQIEAKMDDNEEKNELRRVHIAGIRAKLDKIKPNFLEEE